MQRFKLFGLFIIIISLVCFSCNNYFNDNNNTNNKSTGSLTITVSLDTNLYSNYSRTAIPNNIDIDNFYNNFSLSAYAENNISEDEPIPGKKIEGENNSFHFELKPGEWKIIVIAKYIGPDTETYKDIVFKGKKNITIESNGKFVIDIPITYIKENSGNVNLKINIDEDTKINCVIISNENNFNGEYNINNNYIMIDKKNIPSGNYYLQLDFCHKSNDEITKIISLHEAINIYDNVLTNTWKKTSLTPYIDDNGNFNLTKEIVTKILNTQFYVNGNPSQNINNELPTGSWKNPFHTINDAINKINIINDNSTIYDIFVSGTITEEVPLKILSNTKIRILKDSSITETDEAILKPSDSFKENRIIENSGSLTLSGIKINGNNKGGIKTLPSSELTLNNVTIENCKSEDKGSGISVASDATLNIGGFIKIAGNKTKVGTEEKENNVYLCDNTLLNFVSALIETSQIGITTETTPIYWAPVNITSVNNFNQFMSNFDINDFIKFDTDGYVLKNSNDNQYYCFTPTTNGNIQIDEIKDVKLFLNNKDSSKTLELDTKNTTLTFTAKVNNNEIIFTNKNLPTITVYNHGAIAQNTTSFSLASDNSLSFTIQDPDAWPNDIYQFVLSCIYEGITYTDTFTIKFNKEDTNE